MTDDAMWSLVMFDLPVKTKPQRREATGFRKLLLDMGYTMMQLSAYVRYIPTGALNPSHIARIKRHLPAGGEVRVFHITDRQWSTAFRFLSAEEKPPEDTPTQLAFF